MIYEYHIYKCCSSDFKWKNITQWFSISKIVYLLTRAYITWNYITSYTNYTDRYWDQHWNIFFIIYLTIGPRDKTQSFILIISISRNTQPCDSWCTFYSALFLCGTFCIRNRKGRGVVPGKTCQNPITQQWWWWWVFLILLTLASQ